jgi:PAS domain S-box-containing protein
MGKHISEFSGKDASTMLIERIREVAEKDEAIQYETFFPDKGDGKWYLSMFQPLRDRDGEIIGVQLASHDITEMKRAEELLKKSEEKYRGLFENMLNALALLRPIYDEQGNPVDFEYLEVNRNFEDIFGLKPSDVVGKTIHQLVPEDRIDPQIQKFGTAVTTGEPVEFEWYSKSVDRWHLFSAYRSRKDQLVVIIDDITERKKMEEGLRESIEEKSTLIREINHRVKNNFLTIFSLLRFQAKQFEDRKLKDAFHESQNRVHVMSLIHDRLSKKDDGKSVSLKTYFEPLVQHLADSYRIGSKPVSHHIEIDDITLDIDTAIPLGLILNELISNSLKHGLNEVDNGELHLNVKSHQDGLCTITVRDNGRGLPEDFDIEKPDTLGLELVKTLVDQINGKLLIERNGGTSFIIEFMAPLYCV